MLTKKQMYMLIGFIVIIIASLVMMPETDGFKTFWGLFGLSNRKKNKKSQNVACTSRGLVAKADGTCQSCLSSDSSKPAFKKETNTCVSCTDLTGDPAIMYYSPQKGCVKFCPGATLNHSKTAILGSGTSGAVTWEDKGLRSSSESNNICKV